jgi:hypothetical protein
MGTLSARSKKIAMFLCYGLIMVLSAYLRYHNIRKQIYWIDEMFSLYTAQHENLKTVFYDNTPFLYHLLLKFWINVFGHGERETRLLSALFSVGATGALTYFGWMLRGFWGGIVFGLLHAFSPLSIQYAQETRMYAMVECFTSVNLIFFYRLWSTGRKAKQYALSLPIWALSHYLVIVPMALEVGWLSTTGLIKKNTRRIIALSVSITTGILLFCYEMFFSWPHLEWQNLKFQADPNSQGPTDVLIALLNNSKTAAIGFLTILAAYVFMVVTEKGKHKDKTMLFSFMVLPVLFFTAIALKTERAIFLPRYFIYVLPFFISWSGLVVSDLLKGKPAQKVVAALCVLLILLGSSSYLWTSYWDQSKKRHVRAKWQAAANYIFMQPNNIVFTTRTIAIQSPYFEDRKIPVQKWQPDPSGLRLVAEEARAGKHVWVIDNYWGSISYIDILLQKLTADKDLDVERKDFTDDNAEPLILVHIKKKSTPSIKSPGIEPPPWFTNKKSGN